MKAAIITEEQIKAIEHVLFHGNDAFDYQHEEALAIVQSLKLQEPVAYLDDDLVAVAPNRKGWLTEREDKEWRKFHTTHQYDTPLYALEQP